MNNAFYSNDMSLLGIHIYAAVNVLNELEL